MKIMAQGLAEPTRVLIRCNAGIHVIENLPLDRAINGPQVFLTRGSYSTVQAKVFTQLAGSKTGFRLGETLFGYSDVVGVFLIMLHNEIPHVIRQRYAPRPAAAMN